MPKIPLAPSQLSKPNPIAPGAANAQAPVAVETMAGPFPRQTPSPGPGTDDAATSPPSRSPEAGGEPMLSSTLPPAVREAAARSPSPRLAAPRTVTKPGVARPPTSTQGASGRQTPPPGMTDADVNALYAKYVKAKEMVGENAGPGAYGKLLKTINDQAPKIMEQYKAKGVTFSVVVKDNQVVIRAKPKT
jgi:hypothetical protein